LSPTRADPATEDLQRLSNTIHPHKGSE
jgi:hypothetical protein